MLPRRATCAVVTPASPAGRHSEEEDSEVMGRSGAPYLAAVPQDGWAGFLWYSLSSSCTVLSRSISFLFLNWFKCILQVYSLYKLYV